MNKNERLICAFISALTVYQKYFDKLKEIKIKMIKNHAIHPCVLKDLTVQSIELMSIFERLSECLCIAYRNGCDSCRKEETKMEIKVPITISEKEMKAVIEQVVSEMKSRGDLVYAVRCKDCKNYIDGKCDTILDGYTGGDDFYCAAGEPRRDDDDPELLEARE